MHNANVVSWTTIITGYAQNGDLDNALRLFNEMPQRTVVSWNVMIAAYIQNGIINEGYKLFKKIPQPNVVSWNAIITGYAQNELGEKALEIFKQMQLAGVKPNSVTIASILPACMKMRALELGMEIHRATLESGLVSDAVVVNTLIAMYTKCGSIQKAREMFDKMPTQNVVSWNAMIAGYAQNGLPAKALEIFAQKQQIDVQSDQFTFATVLLVCVKMGALEQGMEIHQKIIESGYMEDVVVATALIDMYAKCGAIQKACNLFERMPQRNTVSWNAIIVGLAQNGFLYEALNLFKEMPQQDAVSWTTLISAYAQNGLVGKALEMFKQMQLAGVQPNSTTFASILPACAKFGDLGQGMQIHQKIIESEFLSDIVVANALIDMYAKCGRIQRARNLFDKVHNANLVSWTTMIAGYALHGDSKHAFELFELMGHSGSDPDDVSFVCVLFACSHAGLVDEGCKYFNLMIESYCIMATIDHYVCIVDLLGRAGYLEEAFNFIIKMPIKPDVVVWVCLLGACRSHINIGLGEFVATLLFELDSKNAAPDVLLSNMYAGEGRWGDVQKVRKLMEDRGIKKMPGCSWIEVHKTIHVFCVGDRSHPQTQEIYAKLEDLSWQMKTEGYMPDKRHALNDVEEEEKELFLCHHSEKLAIVFGLLNTSTGTTIRVFKNLRVCGDCHTATKFISKIVAREIVVRDSSRFHHFKHGQCSCGDYW
ncbi:pentatricopeptide repeat-containing protein At4g02750-like isoform X2 [Cryptomeria japonica]|uniref:pentatricopeptide repeat-containing protein At4g02750-like isoform X2 n=2 Tax=Cryptomeria japonica TaxID=3369 RepID=UPI0027D9DC35|nr:pentatricopeptide repeat-containing protein At4g02750-like isoform X2 [Cryptomeria japonica]